jgi:hypothetical protein
MRRFRLSTLLLLIVIAALCVALVVQERRAARREAELQARLKFPPKIIIENVDLRIPEYQDAYFINGEVIDINGKVIKVGPQDGAARRPHVVETPGAREGNGK